MKNKKDKKQINRIFLACECKPGSDIWPVLETFAYDVKPAYIHGSLGVISYDPESYSIIDINEDNQPLMGYLMTITHKDTILLLDKIKGWYGENSFNYHQKIQVRSFVDAKSSHKAWAYILSNIVLDSFQQIEQIKFGLWDNDQEQLKLLEEIGKE